MNKDFKLPGNRYQEITKIIQAYGHINGSASLEEVSKACGVNTTQISRNNGFLASINIIEGGKEKKITEKGKKLSDAMSYDLNDEVSIIWKQIMSENEFITKMITALKIRKGMDSQSFQSHIAYSSGQKNTGNVRAGANCIIDILLLANMIFEEDDKLIVNGEVNHDLDNTEEQIAGNTNEPVKGLRDSEVSTISTSVVSKALSVENGGININIEVNINARVDELDGLGLKLKNIIDEFKADNTSE